MGERSISWLFLSVLKCSALALLYTPISFAGSYSINLGSPDLFDGNSSTGLWDTEGQKIRAPLAPGGTAGKEFLAGTAEDGAFLNGPSQTGVSVSGNTITFNTSTKSVYQFSRFTLSSGYTLQATGSNPLIIKSVGPVIIAGTINLNGTVGSNNAASGVLTGGAGGAGGGTGGDSGSASGTQPTNGNPFAALAATVPNGGTSYTNSATYGSPVGGDGGCNGNDGGANDATQTSARCTGSTYTVAATAFETSFSGGAGGAGGSAYTPGLAQDKVSGASGGGGGGALKIVTAGQVQVSGNIYAKGGNGGSNGVGDTSTGTECAGSGGGGSGGSIWIQTLNASSYAGVTDVTGGTGGTTINSCAGNGNDHNGGKGSRGVIRLDAPTNPAPTTQPAASLSFNTASLSANQTYTVTSKAIDLSLIDADYAEIDLNAVTITTGCDTTGTAPTLTYQGSQDGSSNWSGAVNADQISNLNGYRYLKINAQLGVSGTSLSQCITGIRFDYTPRVISRFLLKGGLACATISKKSALTHSKNDPTIDFGVLTLLFCMLALVQNAFKRRLKVLFGRFKLRKL